MSKHAKGWHILRAEADLLGQSLLNHPRHRVYAEAELDDYMDVKEMIEEHEARRAMIDASQTPGPVSARAHVNTNDISDRWYER